MIRLLVILTGVGLLQACTTIPKPTLELSDVPVLYESPTVNTPTAAPVVDELKTTLTVDNENAYSEALTNEALEDNKAISQLDTCTKIANEIDRLNSGLGSVAVEEPPNTASPTVAKRAGEYLYNVTTQTILGPLQPLIQTKRAIFNDDEKDKRLAESVERGQTRRAYLIGYAQASGCDQEVEGPVQVAE